MDKDDAFSRGDKGLPSELQSASRRLFSFLLLLIGVPMLLASGLCTLVAGVNILGGHKDVEGLLALLFVSIVIFGISYLLISAAVRVRRK